MGFIYNGGMKKDDKKSLLDKDIDSRIAKEEKQLVKPPKKRKSFITPQLLFILFLAAIMLYTLLRPLLK